MCVRWWKELERDVERAELLLQWVNDVLYVYIQTKIPANFKRLNKVFGWLLQHDRRWKRDDDREVGCNREQETKDSGVMGNKIDGWYIGEAINSVVYYTYIVILVHPISLYLYMKRRVDVGCCHLLYANEYYRRHTSAWWEIWTFDSHWNSWSPVIVRRSSSCNIKSGNKKTPNVVVSFFFFYHRMNRIKKKEGIQSTTLCAFQGQFFFVSGDSQNPRKAFFFFGQNKKSGDDIYRRVIDTYSVRKIHRRFIILVYTFLLSIW